MVYRAGLPVPFTAAYRCVSCGHEVSLSRGDKFPPCRCGDADWDNVAEGANAKRRDDGSAKPAARRKAT